MPAYCFDESRYNTAYWESGARSMFEGKGMAQDEGTSVRIALDHRKIAAFCQRWHITALAFFGSVLRDDFRPDSDVDVLVTFAPDAAWSLLDHVAMEEDLAAILDRKVDIVSRQGIERSDNWIRRKAILETAEPYYAAG